MATIYSPIGLRMDSLVN